MPLNQQAGMHRISFLFDVFPLAFDSSRSLVVVPVKKTDVNNLLSRYPFHFLFSFDFEHNLTARFSSCLRGSFFTKNVNAFERSSPNCAILTSLFSQPFADSLNQKDSHTQVADKREAPVRIVSPPTRTRNLQM